MALAKTITNNQGVDITYWRIVRNDECFCNSSNHIIMFGYVSQQARLDCKDSMQSIDFVMGGADYIESATREQLYTFVKLQDGWTTATDILES